MARRKNSKSDPDLLSEMSAPILRPPPDEMEPIEQSGPEEPAPWIEYETGDGVKWRAEAGRALLVDLDVGEEELAKFHAAICPNEAQWRSLRLLYGIGRMLGESNVEYLSAHSREEVAGRMSMSVAELEQHLEGVRNWWKKQRVAETRTREEVAKALEPDEIKVLIEKHGFQDVPEEDRSFVAGRIRDLLPKLEDEEGRMIAREAIRMELTLNSLGTLLSQLNKELRECNDARKRQEIRDEIKDIATQQEKTRKGYLEHMKSLDATQVQKGSVRQKLAFQATISKLMEAERAYYADADNSIVDGVFTAAEIEVQIRPMSLRPPQYRPDLVALIKDALKPENLFNRDYEPPTMPRATYRRFRKAIMQGLQALDSEEAPVEMEEDSEEFTGETTGTVAVDSDVPVVAAVPQVAPAPLASKSGPSPGDEFA